MRRLSALKLATANNVTKTLSIAHRGLDQFHKTKYANMPFQIVSCHGKVGTGKTKLLHDMIGIPSFEILSHSDPDRMAKNIEGSIKGISSAPFIFDFDMINTRWPLLCSHQLNHDKYNKCNMLLWDIVGQGEDDDILNAFVALFSNVMLLNCKHFGFSDIMNELKTLSQFAKNNVDPISKLGTVIILLRDYQISGPLQQLEHRISEEISGWGEYSYLSDLYTDIKVYGLPFRDPEWDHDEAKRNEKYGESIQALIQYILDILHQFSAWNPNRIYDINALQTMLSEYDEFSRDKVELLWKTVTMTPEMENIMNKERLESAYRNSQ